MSALQIQWWLPKRDVNCSGAPVAPRTEVRLKSYAHSSQPSGYHVYERVPKFLNRFGEKLQPATYLVARPATTRLFNSEYWSEPWLGLRGGMNGRDAVFEARPDPLPDRDIDAYTIRCNELSITRVTNANARGVDAGILVGTNQASLRLSPSLKTGRTEQFDVRAATDPRVRISIIQEEALLWDLTSFADDFAHRSDGDLQQVDLLGAGADVEAYFAGNPLAVEDPSGDFLVDAGHPLSLSIDVPQSDSLRAAFAVSVTDIENGRKFVSEPVFLTSVRGEVISTGLPAGLLDDESIRILSVLDQAGDIETAAQLERDSVDGTWRRVVDATEQLGADNVGDAIALVSITHPHAVEVREMVGA